MATVILLAATACGDDDDDGGNDAGALLDAAADTGPVDPAAACATLCEDGALPPEGGVCFGDALTDAFGRLDGTILAVQGPTDTECDLPNDDHLVLQVLWNGAAYRMVVNVLSDGRNGTDTRLRFAEVPAALPAPPWEEGWHTGVTLDYAETLGVHAGDAPFEPLAMGDLVERLTSLLEIGAPVSVYATSEGRPNATHLVHYNGSGRDGAIVVGPTSGEPRFLLLHFDGQDF
jgi:hypothetical protein